MKTLFKTTLTCAALGFALTLGRGTASAAFTPDRIFVVVMENHSFDEVIGRTDASGFHLLAPFITQLAATNRLATLAYGISQPSLPNYLGLISGNDFGIHDDNSSCFAVPPQKPCHRLDAPNLVDSLEKAGISWGSYNQSMPSIGFLGPIWPHRGDGLYRQKHNPFVYFQDIATNPKRLQRVQPISILLDDLNNHPGKVPRFVFIVPDECHDMHGSTPFCPKFDPVLAAGDQEVQTLVNTILNSGDFTATSLLFLTWDEGDFSNQGCCDSPPVLGGGHIPMIVLTGIPGPRVSDRPYNQYSILATIEELWSLPKLGYTADTKNVHPMDDLIP